MFILTLGVRICKIPIFIICLFLFSIVLKVESSELKNEIQERFNLSNEAYSYLEEALGYMEQGSVNTSNIDWVSLRTQAYQKASNARLVSETYEAIRLAITLLKENHSFFLTPEEVKSLENKNVDQNIDLMQSCSKLINKQIGYLLVPCFYSLSKKEMTEYATKMQQEICKLDEHQLSKWIIDLRGNLGGHMWPIVLGLRPLIGRDTFGFFSNGLGDSVSWNYEGLSVRNGDFEVCSLNTPSYQLYHTQPQIAVLVDNQTASSGEAVAIAFLGKDKTKVFGRKTAGYTSANEEIRLSDGAAILLATTYEADRLGRIYTDGIIPDEIIKEEGDIVLERAIQWLQKDE